MKNSIYCSLLILSVVFSSCGPTRSVSFNITRPGEINLPKEVNTILLIDRTKFDNEMLNVIEGILTGEMPEDDQAAAQAALFALKDKLGFSPRYNVKILPGRFPGNSMTAAFPRALGWDTINSLCKTNNAEIVVSLEVFDSDFIVTHGKRMKKRTEGSGDNKREVEYPEYYAQGVGTVKMGIRSYYNNDKQIIDQQIVERSNSWEGAGSTPMDALALLISKSKANKYLAALIGEEYAYKISPMPQRVSRPFFGKSKKVPAMETGSRYADVNKWQEAIDEWKKAIPGAREKEAGRLAYNIAVGYEVLGEYGNALTWAQDAYTKYGNKEARDYVRTINRRIQEENILREQMK
jgi:hypothetical protein